MKRKKQLYRGAATADRKVLHTKFGDLNLAHPQDRKKAQKLIVELMRTTDALTRKDLGDWRAAWQMAIDVNFPNRNRLYDIYRDVDADLHLTGCLSQRKGFVKARSFKLTKPDGSADEEAIRIFDNTWFKDLMDYCLDANAWGHSLIELGEVTTNAAGVMMFDGVTLIPRKHVIPEKGRVVRHAGETWECGIDYHQPPFSDYLIEAGRKEDLGLYLKAALQTIPKKNTFAFWDQFGEMFGIPFRVAKSTSRDDKDIDEIEKMMETMGSAGWGIFPEGTEVEIKETTRGDAYNVFDKRIDRANSELSKLVILQTMTIEDGSSLSQSQTHLQIFQNLIEDDADKLRDIINGQLLPRMVKFGFPVKDLTFDWDYSIDYTPEQQKAYEEMILNNFEVDGSYFSDKYGIPVGERRSQWLPNDPGNDPVPGGSPARKKPAKNPDKTQNAHRPFFD